MSIVSHEVWDVTCAECGRLFVFGQTSETNARQAVTMNAGGRWTGDGFALCNRCAAETCVVCAGVMTVAIFRGTGVCSENCRKDRDEKL